MVFILFAKFNARKYFFCQFDWFSVENDSYFQIQVFCAKCFSEIDRSRRIVRCSPRIGRLHKSNHLVATQSAITCSKLTIETLEQGVKYVQN